MNIPVIGNAVLFKKWCDKENEYMSKKLYNIKPKINLKCPESFMFSKQRFKNSNNYYSNYNFLY
jgi:hypothetical protein